MSDQELPDWEWVETLEVDYLPTEVQKLVRHVGVLIYLYARSVDEGKDLWDEIRISSIEYRVKDVEIKLAKLRHNNSTTVAELLTTLALSAALSAGVGLLVTGIAAGTAGLARSVIKWHKGIKKVVKDNHGVTVYADVRKSAKLIKDFENEVARSKRTLELKAFYKELDKKLKIKNEAKGISKKFITSFVKGEITTDKDSDLKPSKNIVGDLPISELINDHWDGLYSTVRFAKNDLDDLLRKYKDLHELGMLNGSLNDEKLKDLQKPLLPQLFQSVIHLLPNELPELKELLKELSDGNSVTGQRSNDFREYIRAFAKRRSAHIFVFQLSSLIFRPEVIASSVEIIDYKQLNIIGSKTPKDDYGIKTSPGEYQSPYRAPNLVKPYLVKPNLVKVEWKSNEFKSSMVALLSLLNEPDKFNRTYLNKARKAVTVGKKRTVQLLPSRSNIRILLKPISQEDAALEYAFFLYKDSLFKDIVSSWTQEFLLAMPKLKKTFLFPD